jgi:DNA polymerase (family 10)
MKNDEIAKILYEIAEYLAMDDVAFKPQAYEKAAVIIDDLETEIEEIYKKEGLKGLEKIPTIGKGIAKVIEELLKTGKTKEYERLKKKTPVKLSELTAVEGVGPKIIKKLYQELKIRNLNDLEKAAKAGKIRNLEDFGEKTEQNILRGIEFLRRSNNRFALGFIMPVVRKIEARIKNLPGVKNAIVAGSIRRMKETIGDGDILATVSSKKDAGKIMDFFVKMPEVIHIYSKGVTRSSVRLKNNMDFDLRVVSEKSFGAALQYFTGSKDHNIALRKIAIEKNYKLNEYGVWKKGKIVAGKTEEEIYKVLGLKMMEPELREDKGEIEASLNDNLPDLIGYNDLKGDLQIQTNWSDGSSSIEEYAQEAMRLGLKYIAITDHTISLAIANGLDEKRLVQQGREIDKINSRLRQACLPARQGFGGQAKFKILKSAEVNVLKDGRLDINDETLKKLDTVAIAVHSGFKMSKKEMTERIIKAMKNPNIDILFHPTGRIINSRPPYEIDIEKIIRAAKETKTVLEINAHPSRLDLKDEYARMAKEAGVKLEISSDAHNISYFQFLEFGIAQARRGWVEKKDIINAWPVEKMLKMLK